MNSWLVTPGLDGIVVAVVTGEFVPEYVKLQADRTWREEDHVRYLFLVPGKWHDDVKLFCEGKFSMMSEDAKNMIREFSGLVYRKSEDGKIVTDYRLHALNKSEALKHKWEEIIFDHRDPTGSLDDMELLSIPPEGSFVRL